MNITLNKLRINYRDLFVFWWFVNNGYPWIVRAPSYAFGLGAGVFGLGGSSGQIHSSNSFRVVLYYVFKVKTIFFWIGDKNIENKFHFFRKIRYNVLRIKRIS